MVEEPIHLFVYDLSNGMAAQWGRALTGRQIDGIWHTSLVLYGMEVFYGQGISIIAPPGTTHHGTPLKQLPMGTTRLDRATFMEYIEGMKEVYSAEKYHLLDFNCNSFTNDVLGFLNGNTIPEDIRNLPRDILSTPFGQQMRPMIDQMFSGRSGPPARTAVESLLPANPASGNPTNSSLTSNLQVSSSATSLRSILQASPAVAVMYTSATCGPCVAIKPTFEGLAQLHSRLQFVIVDIGIGGGSQIAADSTGEFGGSVRATPTFRFYVKGKKVNECKGADERELKTQVGMLELEAFPPHPHEKLPLPAIRKLTGTLAPVTYLTVPALPSLASKLNGFIAESKSTSLLPVTSTILTKRVIAYLAALPPTPATPAQPLPPGLADAWTSSTTNALASLPSSEWFPVLDLWRIGLARDGARLSPSLSTVLPAVLALITEAKLLDSPDLAKPLLLTSLRFVSNALPFEPLTSILLSSNAGAREGTTRLIVRALLDQDKSVRSVGAGLVWSVVGRVWQERTKGAGEEKSNEEWEVEVACAVLEALGREKESVEVVHRLSASLGLIMFKSSHFEAIKSIMEALEAGTVLESKKALAASEGRKEVLSLLSEVQLLLS
ncbi:DUF862-domain-containing protein [Meredithblackwellia eburnea MCA 4105]